METHGAKPWISNNQELRSLQLQYYETNQNVLDDKYKYLIIFVFGANGGVAKIQTKLNHRTVLSILLNKFGSSSSFNS